MGEPIDRFPLFPLGIVMLPTEVVPLHIFEDRYRQMVGECLDEEREFGIVWLSDNGLAEVGCTVAITQVLEELPDGRLNILVRGERPFRLLRRIDDMDYPAGEIEPLEDDAGESPEASARARERYAELLERATDNRPDHAELEDLGAYGMAATIEFPLEAKQKLLELRAEDARMRFVDELFQNVMQRLDYVERASERAKSNGRVRY